MNRVFSRPGQPNKNFVDLTISTWEKDSHGLYDYEITTKMQVKKFKIEAPCKIFRNWLTAQTLLVSNEDIKKGKLPHEDLHLLMSVTLNRNGNSQTFALNPPEQPSSAIIRSDPTLPADQQGPVNTNTYLVTKYLLNKDGRQGHPLAPGDTIKLGRMEYLVIECRNRDTTYSIRNTNHLGEKNGVYTADEGLAGSCKICLSDETAPDNVLLSPCKCKGSCELVHMNCLKVWIDSKVKKQVNGIATTYNFTKFECEICKEPFPKSVLLKGKKIEMISIEKPQKPYIIFQSLNERNETKQQKNLHLICADEKVPIKLGRGHQCEIRMTDISVSRVHAQIKFQDNKFFITDEKSKFGTLVKLDHRQELTKELFLQAGRSTYAFQMQTEGRN